MRWMTRDEYEAASFTSGDSCFVAVCDLGDAEDQDSLCDPIAHALEFPDYYGRNWDAFNDCVWDLTWISQPKVVLVIRGFDQAARRLPAETAILTGILGRGDGRLSNVEQAFEVIIIRGSK